MKPHHTDYGTHITYAGVFGVMLSTVMLALHYGLRTYLDLPTHHTALLGVWVLVVATCFGPFVIYKNIGLTNKHSACFFPLASGAILLLPLLALVLPASVVMLCIVFIALAGLMTATTHLKSLTPKQLLFLLAVSIGWAIYQFMLVNKVQTSPAIYGIASYSAPSMYQELGYFGTLYWDHYYHAAVINMLKHYGVIATGLDGLAPYPTHAASHLWHAALSNVLQIPTLSTMGIAVLGAVIPLTFASIALATGLIARPMLSKATQILPLLLGLFLLKDVLIGVVTFMSINSTFAIIFFVLCLPLVDHVIDTISRTRNAPYIKLCILGIMSLLIFACKMQAGVVLGFYVYFLFLRCHFSFFRALIISIVPFFLIINFYAYINYGFSHYVGLYAWVTRPHMWGSWVPIILLLFANRHWYKTPPINKNNHHEQTICPTILYRELIYATTLLLVLLVFLPSGSTVVWMVGAFTYTAIITLVARPPYNSQQFYKWCHYQLGKHTSLCQYGLITITVILCSKHLMLLYNDFSTNITQFTHNHATISKTAPTKASKLVQQVHTGTAQHTLLVFIPPSNTAYWHATGLRIVRPWYLPALLGVPLLKGLPPPTHRDDMCKKEYFCILSGYGYAPYTGGAQTSDTTDQELCTRARNKGFEYVYILQDLDDAKQNKLLDCRAHTP